MAKVPLRISGRVAKGSNQAADLPRLDLFQELNFQIAYFSVATHATPRRRARVSKHTEPVRNWQLNLS
jgi:hypothetical protein